MARPKVPLLSADRIADAARLVDSGELFGVNALARRLGVTPSSLYNHVRRPRRDRRAHARPARRTPRPNCRPAWDEVVSGTLREQRRLYAEHPNAIPLIVGKTITDPLVIASYDNLATALHQAGFPDDEVLVVVAILDSFALGSASISPRPTRSGSRRADETLGRLRERTARRRPLRPRVRGGARAAARSLRLRLARLRDDD